MPFCPKCKNEYYEGVSVCSECNIPLVDSLDEINENDEVNTEDLFLDDRNLQIVDENGNPVFPIDDLDEETEALNALKESFKPIKSYVPYLDRANDCKSSAYTMIPVGILGVIFIILSSVGVFNILDGQLMIKIVMGALFALFAILGFSSLAKAKKYRALASEERETYDGILDFLKTNYSKEAVDAKFDFTNDLTSDEKYYDRYIFLMKELTNAFPDADESFLDYCLCKEFFDDCFND